jgi:D-galactarolactone cycloisomerase
MLRRDFLQSVLQSVPAAAVAATITRDTSAAPARAIPAMPAVNTGSGLNLKITDIKVKKVRLVKELGFIVPRPGMGGDGKRRFSVGGETITEISTDQGITGFGPGVSPAMLRTAQELLIGKDPLQINDHAYNLYNPGNGGANIEIALWDLIGKAANVPLYKLWGGTNGQLMPYASQSAVGTPEERARMAQTVKGLGWQAIKFRTHFPTLKEDVQLVEQTRKVMGSDFVIMCDANQAGNYPDGYGGGPVRWDFQRAMDTAREYQRLGVFWLEEPLPRWDFEQLAKLNKNLTMMTAGGEGSRGLHEWRWMLEQEVFDIMQFEVTIIGPVIARQIAALAQARDKFCVGHVSQGLGTICSGHLAASWPNAPSLSSTWPDGPTWEIFYEPPVADIFQEWSIYENPPIIDKDGYIKLPDAPGLGVTIKADLIQDA